MKTQEYLEEIRKINGFPRAILTEIIVEGMGEVTFFITTDTTYPPSEAQTLREITQKYLPAGFTADVKVTKFVPDERAIRGKILQLLSKLSPAAAAFLDEKDVDVVKDESGARFCLSFSAEEKGLLPLTDLLDKVTAGLSKNFCGYFIGSIKEVDKEAPVLDIEESVEEEAEEYFPPRAFPVVNFESIDGGDKPSKATYIVDCNFESEDLTVCGTILSINERETSKGKPWFNIRIADGSGATYVKYFTRKTTVDKIRELQVGDKIVCSGSNEVYNGNLSFKANHINKGTMPENYVFEERAAKKAPKAYHTVFPARYDDFTQANLFVDTSLPDDLVNQDFVSFDLETTGLNNTGTGGVMDSIIEVGAVKIRGGKIVEKFSTFVACNKKLSEEIVNLTGITDEMLVGAPTIDKVIPDFYKFCDGCALVGHNVTFDYRFIDAYAKKEGYCFAQRTYDTYALAQELLRLPNYKLNTIADRYGFTFNHHRAFDDALTTAKIFIELIKQRKTLPKY